jgi:GT2 family glycosyltransferase
MGSRGPVTRDGERSAAPSGLASPNPPGDGRHPTVSIVSVNFNGRRYLERFLRSLLAIDYPPSCYRLVLVDNASTDGSAAFVRETFPNVHVLQTGTNLGFAGGCNLGIRTTRSDYVVLVNNDTVVESQWLRALVEVAESDPQVGLVGSKLVFLTRFLDVALDTDAAVPNGPRGAALMLHEARMTGCDYDKLIFHAGHLAAGEDDGRPVHTLARAARLAVPIAPTDGPVNLVLTLRAAPSQGDLPVDVTVAGAAVGRLAVTSAPQQFRVEIPRMIVARAARDVINNAGTIIDDEGRFRDRGIFEFDTGQYDVVADVPALCGASVLLRRAMLEEIGGFDTRYFMYFEDVDLSWRARRAGWRAMYTPRSRLRHVHAGSSREGSPLWTFFVGRNHLFWLIKHGTPGAVARAVGAFYARAIGGMLRDLGQRLVHGRRAASATPAAIDAQIARSLARHLPGLLVSRYHAPKTGGTRRWTAVRHEPSSSP